MAGDRVQDAGHAGPDLPRGVHASLVPRGGRQRGRLVAGPAAGEHGVEHPGQGYGVGGGWVGGVRPGQGRVDAQPGDLEAAAGVPAQRAGAQAQVRPADAVRDGEGVRGVGDHGGGQGRAGQPGQHQVLQVRAPRPFRHDVRALDAVVGVVDGGQARIAHPGRGLHRLHHVPGNRDPAGQQVDRDRTAQQLIGGLPQRQLSRRGDPLVEAETSAQPDRRPGPAGRYPDDPDSPCRTSFHGDSHAYPLLITSKLSCAPFTPRKPGSASPKPDDFRCSAAIKAS